MRRLPLILLCTALLAMGVFSSCDGDVAKGSTNSDGKVADFPTSTIPWNASISYGSLTDPRDGQVYRTVKIGTQTWMAQNLNFKVDSSWCQANSPDSCAKYGRLYQWAGAMGLDASYNSKSWSGILPRQGVCPASWHIPNDAEWTVLTTFIGDSAGIKLKATDGWESSKFGAHRGTDAYGFRVLPAGSRYGVGKFDNAGSFTFFWWASESENAGSAWYKVVNYTDIQSNSQGSKFTGFSVRCLQN
ncbi:MAG: fibrobacter succinogenes major paralogous domain-containing protein [Fibrobacteres bacterium]|jgi:uncharacterized protein (TIGR02145 family)|nr:fibrobacter succinogenes major paralogous domain-containing protein [Fibrobacterota bacterium]